MTDPAVPRELVYESTDFRVWHTPRVSRAVVVTFDYWERKRDGFGNFVGGSLMDRAGWSHVHVCTRKNNWYLRPDTGALIAAIARTVRSYDTVTTHGASMGGYAALLIGCKIGATRALVVSPQFSVDPRKVPFDAGRRLDDLPNVDFTWDRLGEWAGELPCAQVLYDPRIASDAQHVALIRQHAPHWQFAPLAFSSHSSLGVFREVGQAAGLVQRLLTEDVPTAEIVRLFKQHRRGSTMFWDRLARSAGRRDALFAWIVAQVLALPRLHPDTVYCLCEAAFERGQLAMARSLLDRLDAQAKNPSPRLARNMQGMRKQLRKSR